MSCDKKHQFIYYQKQKYPPKLVFWITQRHELDSLIPKIINKLFCSSQDTPLYANTNNLLNNSKLLVLAPGKSSQKE